MIFGSLFSGIEAASCAWLPLGWRCAWVAEIDPFACALLAHRYPQVPNLGDVNRIDPDAVEPVDLVVFGSPCQSFSLAGLRLGLDDPRGDMALVGLRVIGRIRPRWVVWENVPGVLSSDGGRDFGAFLGLLGELGYGFGYRVLDAQHFGVPQRRRRVFVVGYLGDWRPAAAVLFEPESLRGDSAPRREAGQSAPASAPSGAVSSKWAKGTGGPAGDECYNLIAAAYAPPVTSNPYGDHESREGLLIAFQAHGGDVGADTLPHLRAGGTSASVGAIPTGQRPGHADNIASGMSVRRLTPRECERLQGLPDDWTAITYRGKPAADGPRYRATGNSMAVPVVAWIGERIQAFEEAVAAAGDAA